MSRALIFLAAHALLAAGLVAIGLSIARSIEGAQPTVLVDAPHKAADREPPATGFVCTKRQFKRVRAALTITTEIA